jgi:hypothetical protein
MICFALGFFLAVLLIFLILFFLFPRIPELKRKEIRSDSLNIVLDGDQFVVEFDLNMMYVIHNPNYVPIYIKSLDVRLSHEPSGVELMSVHKGEVKFPARKTTEYEIQQSGRNSGTNYNQFYEDCAVRGRTAIGISGSITIRYLSLEESLSVSFDQALPCTTINGLMDKFTPDDGSGDAGGGFPELPFEPAA